MATCHQISATKRTVVPAGSGAARTSGQLLGGLLLLIAP